MLTADHITDLERRLTGARNDDARLDAQLDLAWALGTRDPNRARNLADEVCSISRKVLAVVEVKQPTRMILSDASIIARTRLARSLHILGRANRVLSDYTLARRFLDESLSCYEAVCERESAADVMINIGVISLHSGDAGTSLEYFKQSLEIKEELADRRGIAMALGYLGRGYEITGDFDGAFRSYQRSLTMFTELGDKINQATANSNMGHLYHLTGNFTLALEKFNQSLPVFEEENDHNRLASTLNSIGSLYSALHDYEHAADYLQRSLELKERTGDRRGIATMLSGLGDIARHMREPQKAIDYYRRSIGICEAIGERRIHASNMRGMASVYIALTEIPAAIASAESSLELCEAIGDRMGIAESLVVGSSTYLEAEEFDAAQLALDRALEIASSVGAKPLLADIHRQMSALYKRTGHFREALHHYELSHQIDKEFFTDESDKRAHTLMVSLELERAEKAASILRLTNQQLEQEIEFKKRELTATALYLTQKNEFLHKLQRKIRDIAGTPNSVKEFESVLAEIDDATDSERYWGSFEQQFQQVHKDFHTALAERFPRLTPTESKVCALIKINLASKEIAQVLNTETRTVERYRQRIRKKLGISQQENLTTFLTAL